MEFLRTALNWFGEFAGGIFDDIRQQVYYRTGSTGVLGFILLLFKKWYLIVMVPAITALYYIIQGLDSIGVIDNVETFVISHLNMVVDVAHYCTPKLFDRQAFLDCLNDPSPNGQ
jgi:hypothetical protein